MLDPVEFGKSMAAIVKEATAPLLKRIEQLEARQPERGEKGEPGECGPTGERGEVGARGEKGDPGERGADGARGPEGPTGERGPQGERGEAGERGEQGERGEPGKDADPIDVREVVAELADSPEIKTVLDLLMAEAVADYLKANPVQNGKDGNPGRDGKDGERGPQGERGPEGQRGPQGEKGMDGRDGRDGLPGVPGLPGEKGLDGKDGRDGVDGKDGRDGKNFDKIRHIGFWQSGMSAKQGEFTTHDGCLWFANQDTSDTPSHQSKDWQLAARKGSDGQRGRDGRDYVPPKPVKLAESGE